MQQEEDHDKECDEGNKEEIWDLTIEDIKRLRQILTPPDDVYDAPATDLILDEILEEFRVKILDIIAIDEEGDCNPTTDIKELKRLLAKDPQSYFTKIHVHSVI
nr:hypothetical protein [Tanacetum cinerariifolium]